MYNKTMASSSAHTPTASGLASPTVIQPPRNADTLHSNVLQPRNTDPMRPPRKASARSPKMIQPLDVGAGRPNVIQPPINEGTERPSVIQRPTNASPMRPPRNAGARSLKMIQPHYVSTGRPSAFHPPRNEGTGRPNVLQLPSNTSSMRAPLNAGAGRSSVIQHLNKGAGRPNVIHSPSNSGTKLPPLNDGAESLNVIQPRNAGTMRPPRNAGSRHPSVNQPRRNSGTMRPTRNARRPNVIQPRRNAGARRQSAEDSDPYIKPYGAALFYMVTIFLLLLGSLCIYNAIRMTQNYESADDSKQTVLRITLYVVGSLSYAASLLAVCPLRPSFFRAYFSKPRVIIKELDLDEYPVNPDSIVNPAAVPSSNVDRSVERAPQINLKEIVVENPSLQNGKELEPMSNGNKNLKIESPCDSQSAHNSNV